MGKMTNEEKVKKIGEWAAKEGERYNSPTYTMCCVAGFKVAEWKDQEFKKYLNKLHQKLINNLTGTMEQDELDRWNIISEEIINKINTL